MNDSTDAACATDVVRCLYLARVAERLGHQVVRREAESLLGEGDEQPESPTEDP